MVEAKTAPRISLVKEAPLERAFRDLESQVCDLKNMSIITELAIENMQGDECGDGSDDIQLRLSRDEFNSMQFAVIHLGNMIRKFHEAYFEGFITDRAAKDEAAMRVASLDRL